MAKQPNNPFHPGEILIEEFLEPMGMTQAAFARQLGWTKARLNELIRGKRGITAESIAIVRTWGKWLRRTLRMIDAATVIDDLRVAPLNVWKS